MKMSAALPSRSLPPYNRFDKVPLHALQCGLTSVDPECLTYAHWQHSSPHIPCGHQGKHDSLSSPDSTISSAQTVVIKTDSSSSSTDAEASSNAPNTSNSSSTSMDQPASVDDSLTAKFKDELYIEQSSPPPYSRGQTDVKKLPTPPSRENLPEKSLAARQSVAGLLREYTVQEPYGKRRTPSFSLSRQSLNTHSYCQESAVCYITKHWYKTPTAVNAELK